MAVVMTMDMTTARRKKGAVMTMITMAMTTATSTMMPPRTTVSRRTRTARIQRRTRRERVRDGVRDFFLFPMMI